jgi:hypothetical protein
MKDDQITLRLPADLARLLRDRAHTAGAPASQLVREALQRYLMDQNQAPGSAWERVAPLVGSIALDPTALKRDPIAARIRAHNWRK